MHTHTHARIKTYKKRYSMQCVFCAKSERTCLIFYDLDIFEIFSLNYNFFNRFSFLRCHNLNWSRSARKASSVSKKKKESSSPQWSLFSFFETIFFCKFVCQLVFNLMVNCNSIIAFAIMCVCYAVAGVYISAYRKYTP